MSASIEQAEKMIKDNEGNPNFEVVDVRTCLERRLSYIPGSKHVPLSDLDDRLSQFNKDKSYLVYCRSGNRSQTATNTLNKQGFKAINMRGGMNNWNQETESNCSII